MLDGKRVLVVEDNEDMQCILGRFLEIKGAEPDFALNGDLGLELGLTHEFDVIILDVMLPRKDGMQVAKELRDNGCETPILMLTALNSQEDLLNGFGSGVDDFVTKPFQLPELEVRLNALITRFTGNVAKKKLIWGGIEIDEKNHLARRSNILLETTPVMYQILVLLVKAQGGVVTRETIIYQLWGVDAPEKDLLRSHIYMLRTVLDKPFKQKLLTTVPKIGFRLEK
ncbi:response regulator transcription factor [Vibrio tasmaniensis]|uniref:response regulator transcription factor n=1 Tax=Vibrio tasmaniensis TaxID=212663 RepID=UPI00107F353A|nr:response regulator transcription factor [Vibrio tasmaniensis]